MGGALAGETYYFTGALFFCGTIRPISFETVSYTVSKIVYARLPCLCTN